MSESREGNENDTSHVNMNGGSAPSTVDELPTPPKVLVRSVSAATGPERMGYTNGHAPSSASGEGDTDASPLHSTKSDSSSHSTASYDSSPSTTAIERALVDAPGVTTDRIEIESVTSTEDGVESVDGKAHKTPASTPALAASTSTTALSATTQAPRSLPVLERSFTASELLTRRQKEIQSARGANDKVAFLATSTSSATAPSFEIESVVLPSNSITEIEIEKTMHTQFAVEVRLHGGLQWIIKKRYSDFRELHDRLKRTNASVKSLYFPKRHVFRSRNQGVVEQRRSELEKYINEVLEIRPLIRVPLFNFLEVYVHMESYERKVLRHKKELESERMKDLLEPEILDDLSAAFKRLCSSTFLFNGTASAANAAPPASNGATEKKEEGETTTTTTATPSAASSSTPTSPAKDKAASQASTTQASTTTSTEKVVTGVNGAAAIPQTAGAQIYLTRTSFRRDVLGVFPDMPSSFAMRFMKALSDRQGADINMDEFLRAIAVLRRGTIEDKLRYVFNMCDLDHSGKVQSTGLSNFLVSLHGRHVLDRSEYRRILTEAFDQGRIRMSADEFVATMPKLGDEIVDDLLIGWMEPFVDVLCETPDPHLLESQEEFNPAVQQKILATETQFSVKEVSMLQDAFTSYRASGGGDAVDLDALSNDFPLEMTDERFHRVFSSFGQRANGTEIDIFSFVNALAIACRGTPEEKAHFAFTLFATTNVPGNEQVLMGRDNLYGMLRLDLAQNAALEKLVERYNKKTGGKAELVASEGSGVHTPSVSGSQLGRFVDALMKEFGHTIGDGDSTDSKALTKEEFLAWTVRESYEMSSLRIMREVVFVDLGLVPNSKEEELCVAKSCYKTFDPSNLAEDDAWFLLEKKWFDHWCKYINLPTTESLATAASTASSSSSLADLASKLSNSASSTSKPSSSTASSTTANAKADASVVDSDGNYIRPKPMNNYPLLTNERSRERVLKSAEEIKLGKHYVVIPEQLWLGLKVWYGGGPEIRRRVVIRSDGSTVLDIWGDELKKKAKSSKKKSSKKGKKGSDDTDEDDDSDEDDDDDDDAQDSAAEEEKKKRNQSLALPRRVRTGGSVGLTNLGNTCYMNSALQCLANTQLLAEYFLSGMYLEDINRTSTLGLHGKLAEVYGKLAEDMWCAKQKALSPRNFKKTIGKFNEAFRGSDQQDAQELLAFLLSGLSEDLNRIQDKPYVEQPDSDGRFDGDLADEWWRNHLHREVSIIVALFTGQYKSLLTCSECGFKSARFEPFTFLQLPLPEPTHSTVTLVLVLANGMPPMKVSVRLGISATVFDLKHELMKLCQSDFNLPDITEADIKVCEYSGSMILSFKADNRRIGQIRSIERLIAFQLERLDAGTIQATRHRRPSYVPSSIPAVRIEEMETERSAQAKFYEILGKGALVEVKRRSQSHDYIPGIIVDVATAPSPSEEDNADEENAAVYTVRLQRVDEEVQVPLNRLRPRQARLLYIPLLSRKLSYSALYFKNPFRPAPFGIPNLVRICPELMTGYELYKLVWQRVKRYVEDRPLKKWDSLDEEDPTVVSNRIDTVFTGLSSTCGFVLRRVESKGLTDSRSNWLTRSFGYVIPCNDEPLSIMEEETIAIDWDLKIFQDRSNLEKMRHIESHASVEKNEAIDKGPVPLRHCLDAFTTEEKISEGYCSSCRKHLEMTKKLEIWRLPPVMVIHMKRFQYTQTYRRKLASLVEFPVHGLDLEPCVASPVEFPERYPVKMKEGDKATKVKNDDATSTNATETNRTGASESGVAQAISAASIDASKGKVPESNGASSETKTRSGPSKSRGGSTSGPGPTITRVRRGYTNTNLDQSRCLETKYDLYSVVNHQGALGGGHYTAYAKNFLDDQWYYYDDERVRVVEESKVVSPSAYLLFYVRSDMKGMLVKDLYPQNTNKKITEEDIDRFVEDDRRCRIM